MINKENMAGFKSWIDENLGDSLPKELKDLINSVTDEAVSTIASVSSDTELLDKEIKELKATVKDLQTELVRYEELFQKNKKTIESMRSAVETLALILSAKRAAEIKLITAPMRDFRDWLVTNSKGHDQALIDYILIHINNIINDIEIKRGVS